MMHSLAIDGPTHQELLAWCREHIKNGFRIDYHHRFSDGGFLYGESFQPVLVRGEPTFPTKSYAGGYLCFGGAYLGFYEPDDTALTLLCNDERELVLAKVRWHVPPDQNGFG